MEFLSIKSMDKVWTEFIYFSLKKEGFHQVEIEFVIVNFFSLFMNKILNLLENLIGNYLHISFLNHLK